MVNTKKIKALMTGCGMTQAYVSKELDISQPTFNQKLNNRRQFTLDEARILQRMLQIEDQDFCSYFFCD